MEFLKTLAQFPIVDLILLIFLVYGVVVGLINGFARKTFRIAILTIFTVIFYFSIKDFAINWIKYYSFSSFNYVLTFSTNGININIYSVNDLFLFLQNLGIDSELLMGYLNSLSNAIVLLVVFLISIILSTFISWLLYAIVVKRILKKWQNKKRDKKEHKNVEETNENSKNSSETVVNKKKNEVVTLKNSQVIEEQKVEVSENSNSEQKVPTNNDKDDKKENGNDKKNDKNKKHKKKRKDKYRPTPLSRLLGAVMGVVEWLLIFYIFMQINGTIFTPIDTVFLPQLMNTSSDLYTLLTNFMSTSSITVEQLNDIFTFVNVTFNPTQSFVFGNLITDSSGIWMFNGVVASTSEGKTTYISGSVQENAKVVFEKVISALKELNLSNS